MLLLAAGKSTPHAKKSSVETMKAANGFSWKTLSQLPLKSQGFLETGKKWRQKHQNPRTQSEDVKQQNPKE
jgi:hypothetical protein